MERNSKIFPYTATYNNRTPDPGVCIVLAIDWEAGNAEIASGCCRCRYFPNLEDITLAENPDYNGGVE